MNCSFNSNSISSLKTFCLSKCFPSFSLCYQLHQDIFHQSYSHKLPQCFISVSHPHLSQLYSSGSYSSESLEEMDVSCSALVKSPFLSSIWGFSQTIWPDKKQLFKASESWPLHNFFVFVFCIYVCQWCQIDWLTRNALEWLVHQSKTVIFTNSNLITKVPKCMCEDWYDLLIYVNSDYSAEITSSRDADSTWSVLVGVAEVFSWHKSIARTHTHTHITLVCILNHMIKSMN